MTLEEMVKEAIAIGVAARDATTAALQQQAAHASQRHEELCG
jgi:hypothetical protein